jgi:acyl-CoA synthetase (AMP-forming)/AMP-acid ligase II
MESNIGFTLTRTSRRYSDKVAIVFKNKRITYKQLNERVNRLANALMAIGLRKGMKVALVSNNSNEFVESVYASFKIGAVIIPINTRLTSQEIYSLIDHSDASFLIFDKPFQEKVEETLKQNKKIERIIANGDEAEGGFLYYESLIGKAASTEPKGTEVKEVDEACIIYTAGTTGNPNGAVLTHRNLLWNSVNYCISQLTSPEDISLYVFPLYHIGAMGTYIAHAFIGAEVHLKDKVEPEDCLETIEREGINRWSAVPTIYANVCKLPQVHKYKLNSVLKLCSGAAPMSLDLKNKLTELFPNAGIFDSYGQTESAGAITILSPKDALRKPASVGFPCPTYEIRIANDKGEDVVQGEVGELLYDGYTRMSGYYKDPEATQEVMRGGWMHSGDLVRADGEGYVYIVDRKKDMIITGGENVYSKEIEDTIVKLPQVAEVAVIGLPNPKWGEIVTAVVVLTPGAQLFAKEVFEFCKNSIASYKCPKKVILAESLPKNAVGKILKKELKRLYLDPGKEGD